MEIVQENLEQIRLAEQQELAAGFVVRLDAVQAKVDEVGGASKWPLRFPAKEGHPGLGLMGYPGYDMQPGELEMTSLEGGYSLTLWSTNEQKLGRPHSLQSSESELAIQDSLYDGLQVVLLPHSDTPITFNWVIKGWKQEAFPGIWSKHIRYFADTCILQAERKTGLKPKPVHQLVGAAALEQ